MKIKLPIIIFVFSILYLVFSGRINAQTSTRVITIVPPTKELAVSPGDKTEGTLKVINDSNQPLTFTVTVRDYVVNDKAGTPDILPPNTLSNKYSASAWIAPDPDQFTIAAHGKQEIAYYVQVPADARPGGHYAAIVYEPTEIIGVNGTGAGVQTQIGTLFYINVKGNIQENAYVSSFSAKGFSEYGPVALATEIQNNGDLHIKPVGSITVKNLFGQTVATKTVEPHNIFPGKSFLYKNTFGQKLMIGRYTARLTATYGQNGNLPLVATVSFIVFPWKMATIATLIVVIIILLLVALEKRKKKKEGEPEAPIDHPAI